MRNFRKTACALCSGMLLAVAAATGGAMAAAPYVTIDLPGADHFIVNLVGISGHETIVGNYSAGGTMPGFVRTPDGTVTTFSLGRSIAPMAINLDGDVVGSYFDGSLTHGFLRTADGTLTTLDVPGAYTTYPFAINDSGDIGGGYNVPGTFVEYGFLRRADGTIKTFGVPGQTVTWPVAMNKHGAIAGYYGQNAHGFIRGCGGKITSFDLPGGQRALDVGGLTDAGDVVGTYTDFSRLTHGYVRHADGSFDTFDVPNADPARAIVVTGVNAVGDVVGYYSGSGGIHGFARAPDGTIAALDMPIAHTLETHPQAVGPNGKVVGYYKDISSHYYGFRLNAAGAGF